MATTQAVSVPPRRARAVSTASSHDQPLISPVDITAYSYEYQNNHSTRVVACAVIAIAVSVVSIGANSRVGVELMPTMAIQETTHSLTKRSGSALPKSMYTIQFPAAPVPTVVVVTKRQHHRATHLHLQRRRKSHQRCLQLRAVMVRL
jgi:hypothetical protein